MNGSSTFGLITTLLLLSILTTSEYHHHTNDDAEICPGSWSPDSNPPAGASHFTINSFRDDVELRNKGKTNETLSAVPPVREWLMRTCPMEIFMHNCYYHGSDRARRIDEREWISTSPDCKPFWPLSFLTTFQNKTIIIAGDSTAEQLWSALVCSLWVAHQPRVGVDWAYFHGMNEWKDARICPLKDIQCVHKDGIAIFEEVKLTIQVLSVAKYEPNLFTSLVQKYYLTSSDIVLLNFGLHYWDGEEQYKADINAMSREYEETMRGKPSPRWFFFESFQQHYGTMSPDNGYYNVSSSKFQQVCSPLRSLKIARETNWRRTLLRAHLHRDIPLIAITEGLLTQWDAHIDRDSAMLQHVVAIDCTHICHSSGAMRYILRMVYNTLLAHIPENELYGRQKSNAAYSAISTLSHEDESTYLPKYPFYRDGSLLGTKSSPTIYLMERGRKRMIWSGDIFLKHGWKFSSVFYVEKCLAEVVPDGPPVME